ncbi:MAG: hypothetical protein M3Z37_09840 [Candidatus Eremiobacteraeota bacterium]|nr:hypothetical protein [Candidatus Eremiobacteraeota bacterium]
MLDGDLRVLTPGTTMSGWDLFRPATKNERSFPSPLPAAMGRKSYTLDGPGYFVLKDRAGEVYTRSVSLHAAADGSLVDDCGRALLTTSSRRGGASGSIPADRMLMAQASKSFVDADGFTRQGRVRLAIFQAPNALRIDNAVWLATPAAGPPRYFSPGEQNVAAVREAAAQPDMRQLHAFLHDLWMASGRASLELAMAAAKDGFTRTALGLVK